MKRNLQGDIVAIYNEDGEQICTYTYDAWGNCTVSTPSSTTGVDYSMVHTYNPFRYRSYFYDVETGLYYLQSRYYNPEWGRFINADAYVSTGQGLLGNNMFVYCNNSPIMLIDPAGEWSIKKALTDFACGVVSFEIGMIADAINYSKSNTDVTKVYESNYFSSYNGALVIRHSSDFLTSWSIGGVIFLNHDNDGETFDEQTDTLNHEYGHIKQEETLGIGKYVLGVAIPSMIHNLFSRKDDSWADQNYYNMPWEYDADVRGGVNRGGYSSWANFASKLYMAIWGE